MEEKLYELATGETKATSQGELSAAAIEEVPKNFGKQVIASVFSKIGDQLSKPGLILTWMLSALGAPAAAIGMLVPVREAGSLLPQMVVSSLIRSHQIRKGFWVAGALLQGASVVAIGFVALTMKGAAAGWSTVGLLVLFSLARGFSSISSKDLLGKTIPKKRRGRLGGLASSISGWFAVGVGLFFFFHPAKDLPIIWYASLLFVAGGLWVIAAGVMSTLREMPSDVSKDENPFAGAARSLAFLRDDPTFLRFCIARALLASTVLSMPFYVVLAHGATGGKTAALGLLLLAGSLASAFSGLTWGKLSDESSRKTLAIAGLSAGAVGCLTAAVAGFEFTKVSALVTYGILFFLIGLAHTGIRVGRKTYLVDHADPDNRARLVAVSNTLMGVVLLVSGSFGILASVLGERIVILVFALLGIAGAVLAFTLPEAGEDR